MEYNVTTIDPTARYPWPWARDDQPMSVADVERLTFEMLHHVAVSYLVLVEIYQLYREVVVHGHPMFYFLDFGQVVDVTCLTMQIRVLLSSWKVYNQIMLLDGEIFPDLAYDTLEDIMAFGRINQVNANMASFQALLNRFDLVATSRVQNSVWVNTALILICKSMEYARESCVNHHSHAHPHRLVSRLPASQESPLPSQARK